MFLDILTVEMSRYQRIKVPFQCIVFILVTAFAREVTGQVKQQEAVNEVKQLIENFRFDEAVQRADLFLASDSVNNTLLLLKSRALSSRYQFREANEVLVRVIRTDSANVSAWFELFTNYRLSGNQVMAAFCGRKLMTLQPSNSYFALQLANLHYNHDDYDSALEILGPLWRQDTNNLYVTKQLGNCYNELKLPDSAMIFYSRALILNPHDASTVSKLINIYLKKKEFPVALMVALGYLSLDSLNPGILRLTGYCWYLLKDYETARDYFLKSIGAGDDSKFNMKYLGLCYYKTGQYDLAEPYFRQAYLVDTTDSEITFYYGVSAHRSMLTDTGLLMLNRTLKLITPDEKFLATVYGEIAAALNNAARPDSALAVLLKAIEACPASSGLLFKIAYQYDYYLRKPFEALPWYRKFAAVAQEPGDWEPAGPQQVSMIEYVTKRIPQIAEKQK